MRGSRRVLVKVVLFQLRGRGHPQDRAMPNFFPDSKSSILGLSNEVSFVTEYFWKGGENQENIFPLYLGCLYFLSRLYSIVPNDHKNTLRFF